MDSVYQIEAGLGAHWPHLHSAQARTRKRLTELKETLGSLPPQDISIVVFGSLAREELTSGSDTDWTLLVDGLANPRHFDASLEIREALESLKARGPGRQATFGGLAFSHDIRHRIGGEDDTNRNTTQRILSPRKAGSS